jgi:hypothetical protein
MFVRQVDHLRDVCEGTDRDSGDADELEHDAAAHGADLGVFGRELIDFAIRSS